MRALVAAAVFAGVLPLPGGAAAEASKPAFPVSGSNFTVRLTITGMRYAPAYGDASAPPGRQFLILNAEWRDVIDADFARGRELPLGAKDDNLSESLALLIDRETSIPVASREPDTAHLAENDPDLIAHSGGSTDAVYLRKVVGLTNAEGKRSLVYYALAAPAATASGELVFEVPLARPETLELRYHDPTGGDLAIPLIGAKASAHARAEPPDPPDTQTNEVLAIAARVAADDPPAVAPPPGRRWVTVAFQGRSRLKVEDAFPPYDPAHPAGATWWRPDPTGWVEFHESVNVIADGALPCGLEKESELPADPEFPAQGWARFRLRFLVPAETKSLDLECFFPDYTIPGHDAAVTPKPMRFHLAGPPATEGKAAGGKQIVDGDLQFTVSGHRLLSELAGEKAADGERFLVVGFQIRNHGAEVGRFTAGDQCVWFNQGQETPPDDLSSRAPHAPPASFPIGPGEFRAFEVAWRVPATLKKLEMGLKGNVVAEKFTLAADAAAHAP